MKYQLSSVAGRAAGEPERLEGWIELVGPPEMTRVRLADGSLRWERLEGLHPVAHYRVRDVGQLGLLEELVARANAAPAGGR